MRKSITRRQVATLRDANAYARIKTRKAEVEIGAPTVDDVLVIGVGLAGFGLACYSVKLALDARRERQRAELQMEMMQRRTDELIRREVFAPPRELPAFWLPG